MAAKIRGHKWTMNYRGFDVYLYKNVLVAYRNGEAVCSTDDIESAEILNLINDKIDMMGL